MSHLWKKVNRLWEAIFHWILGPCSMSENTVNSPSYKHMRRHWRSLESPAPDAWRGSRLGCSSPFCTLSKEGLHPVILRLCSPHPGSLGVCPEAVAGQLPIRPAHLPRKQSLRELGTPGRLTAPLQVYEVHSLTISYPLQKINENGAFKVCICSLVKCRPENWSNIVSAEQFQISSSSLEWMSGLVIIASRVNDVPSVCCLLYTLTF